MRRIRNGLSLTLLAAAVSSGCRPSPSYLAAIPKTDESILAYEPSPHPVIGQLLWFDPVVRQAVISVTSHNPSDIHYLLARDTEQRLTAIMAPLALQRGKSLAVSVLAGTPQVGDEIVPANADEIARIQHALDDSN